MPGHLDKSSKKPSAPASLGGKEPAPPNDAPSKALRGGAGASSSDEAKASGEAKVSSEKHAVPPPTPSKTPPTPGSGVEGVEPGPTPVKQTGSTGPAVTAPAEKPAAGGEASTFVVVGSSSSSLPSSASLAASSSASSSSSSFVSYPSHSSSSSSGPPLRLMKVDPEAPVFPDSPDSAVSGSLEVPAMAKAALLANLQQGVKNLDKDQRQILSGLFADMNLAAPESVQKKEKKRERLAAVASNPSHAAKGKKKQQQLSRGLALPAPQPTLAGPQQAQAQQPEGSSPSTSEEAAATGESRGDDKDGRDDHSDGDDDIDDAEESLLSDSLLSDAIQGLKFLSEGRMVDRSKIYVENGSLMVYAPKGDDGKGVTFAFPLNTTLITDASSGGRPALSLSRCRLNAERSTLDGIYNDLTKPEAAAARKDELNAFLTCPEPGAQLRASGASSEGATAAAAAVVATTTAFDVEVLIQELTSKAGAVSIPKGFLPPKVALVTSAVDETDGRRLLVQVYCAESTLPSPLVAVAERLGLNGSRPMPGVKQTPFHGPLVSDRTWTLYFESQEGLAAVVTALRRAAIASAVTTALDLSRRAAVEAPGRDAGGEGAKDGPPPLSPLPKPFKYVAAHHRAFGHDASVLEKEDKMTLLLSLTDGEIRRANPFSIRLKTDQIGELSGGEAGASIRPGGA